jgi:hypothetical protein
MWQLALKAMLGAARHRRLGRSALHLPVRPHEIKSTVPGPTFGFKSRNRRPPRDPVNCLQSFAYALLMKDCFAALATHFDGTLLQSQIYLDRVLREQGVAVMD